MAWPWLIGALLLFRLATAEAAGPAPGGGRRGGLSAAAQALCEKGKAALHAKDYAAARSALEQAYRAAAVPEVLFLLGQVAEADGRLLEAHDLMRRFLIDPARRPDEAAVAEAQRVVKLPRPPSGQIVVLGAPGSLVMVDDRLLGSVPLAQPLLVSPGEHRLSLQLGSRRLDSPVPVQAGRSFEVRFNATSGAVLITLLPAVLWVTEQVGVPDEAQNPLADAAEQAARAANQTLLTAEAALAHAPAPKDCLTSPPCWQDLARKNEVEYVLSLRAVYEVASPPASKPDPAAPPQRNGPAGPTGASTGSSTSSSGGDSAGASGSASGATAGTAAPAAAPPPGSWQLTLSLWHVDIAAPAATSPARCMRCTAEQAAAVLKQTALKLLAEGLHRSHGSFTITSEPAAAQVFVDGKRVGVTPYKQAAWTGTYNIELRQKNFEPAQRTIAVGDDKPEQIAVTLAPAPIPEPAPPPVVPPLPPQRPTWRLATGAGLLGASVAFLGIGGRAANIAGQCVGYNPFGICTQVYDTAGTAAGLLVTGSLMAVAGVVLLALPPKPRQKAAVLQSP